MLNAYYIELSEKYCYSLISSQCRGLLLKPCWRGEDDVKPVGKKMEIYFFSVSKHKMLDVVFQN